MSSILRGGRITATRSDVVKFISSVEADRRIAHSTVLLNEAHVIALANAKAIKRSDAGKLLRALRKLEKRITLRQGVEDVHVLIEEYVTRATGPEIGGLLHLGKSRNDQVATAIRMTLREEMLSLSNHLLSLERAILETAKKHTTSVFPGYTHLQPAQPITFAHYLISLADSMLRDNQRVIQAFDRISQSPMGAAALAGTSLSLDRHLVAHLLGFRGLVENSLDAVGGRDFILESLSVFSIIALNLSRIAQDIIFYSCSDVALLVIPDEFCSTSSIMPQKKNPDPIELVRAKCGRIVGNYLSAATIMHGLPSGYNLDFQEITPLVWESLDTLNQSLNILQQLIPKLKLNKDSIEKRLESTTATEIANILVREEKLSFRVAHQAVGKAVRITLRKKARLKDLTSRNWETVLGRQVSRRTILYLRRALDPKLHIYAYKTAGSPNPKRTQEMIRRRTILVQSLTQRNKETQGEIMHSLRKLAAF